MQSLQGTSRRVFLNQAVCVAAGAALGPLSTSAFCKDTDGPRFEVSMHLKSLEKLFNCDQLDLRKYPKFAYNVLHLSNVEISVEWCAHLLPAPENAGPCMPFLLLG